jgi:CheY-like chemotaxis protein
MKKVVLIDDDDDDQELFKMALDQTKKTAKLMGFTTCKDAIREVSLPAFYADLIFLDVNMPGMGGPECLREFRKLPHLRSIPIYIYTTSASPADRDRLLRLGATEIVIKPTKMKELVNVLSKLLDLELT